MPGMVGIISKQERGINERNLNDMISCMNYEPFYSYGSYINDTLGVYAGWVCHKGSFSDCMSVFNENKDLVLIFSGENFHDQGFEDKLSKRGHDFNPLNASTLIHIYEEEGEEFLKQLNGWFSGLLIDIRKQIIILFNDRYGLNRVYYHEKDDGFYFSSEAKALLRILPELRQLDYASLGELFYCGCVLQNKTLFPKISLLPGGSKWIFNGTRDIKKSSYFNREIWESQPLLSEAEYYEKLKETFARILPKYFRGSRPLGMSLTGGLDGRMIMAWSNCRPNELPCYTFGSKYRCSHDVRIARKVAKTCRKTHETIVIGEEFFPQFPYLAEKAIFVSDGTMDVSGSVELFANKIARRISPIRLTGNYGSEILRGIVTLRAGNINDSFFEPSFLEMVRNAGEVYQSERRCHNVSFIAFKQVPWHHYGLLSLERSQLTLRSPYLDNDLVALMYQTPRKCIVSQQP